MVGPFLGSHLVFNPWKTWTQNLSVLSLFEFQTGLVFGWRLCTVSPQGNEMIGQFDLT
jgi:hypothetical protein